MIVEWMQNSIPSWGGGKVKKHGRMKQNLEKNLNNSGYRHSQADDMHSFGRETRKGHHLVKWKYQVDPPPPPTRIAPNI